MNKAFLIRGFKLSATAADSDFESVREVIRESGYEVMAVDFTWNHKSMTQYADKFVNFYNRYKGTRNIIIGHSFGAMAALTSATRTMPDLLVLCSLSGFFKEDLPKYTDDDWIIRHMGKKRRADFEALSATTLAKQIKAKNIKSVMIYGELEKKLYPHLYSRVQQTAAILQPARLIEVPGADHSIRGDAYLKALKEVLSP